MWKFPGKSSHHVLSDWTPSFSLEHQIIELIFSKALVTFKNEYEPSMSTILYLPENNVNEVFNHYCFSVNTSSKKEKKFRLSVEIFILYKLFYIIKYDNRPYNNLALYWLVFFLNPITSNCIDLFHHGKSRDAFAFKVVVS